MKPKSAITLLLITKPLLQVSRIFGIIPFEIKKDSTEIGAVNQLSNFWYWYRLIPILIGSAYTLFLFVAICISIKNGNPLFGIVQQSMWLSNAVISWFVTIFICLRSRKMCKIFETYATMERRNKPLFCPIRTKLYFWLLFSSYFMSACGSVFLCGLHAAQFPMEKIYPAHYIFKKEKEYFGLSTPPVVFVYIYALFQMILISWKWVSYGFLEIICCVFANMFALSLKSISNELELLANQNNVRLKKNFS